MIMTLNPATAGAGLPLPEFAILAAGAGFEAIEINSWEVANLVRQTSLDEVRAIFDSNHLVPAAFGLPVDFRGSEEDWRAGLASAPEAISAAVAVGCRRCLTWIMPRSDKPFEDNWNFHVERLKPAIALLKDQGVTFGVEFVAPKTMRTGPHDFIWNMDQALRLSEEIGGDGILLDSFHWFCAGLGSDDIERLQPKQIVHVHINDAPDAPPEEQIDNVRLLPGEGTIDLASFLRSLDKIGYNGPVSVEVFSEDLHKFAQQEAARRAHDSLESVMKKAGL